MRPGERFGGFRVSFWPGFPSGNAGGADFYENGVGRNVARIGSGRRGEVLVAGEEDLI